MAEAINPSIFRAYDIRGLVDVDLTEETMYMLGQAAGTFFRRQEGRTLVVGRDVRPSSPRFQAALSAGLQQAGIDVIDIGEVATPVMYFAVEYLRAGGGIVISASHNPPEYNGVKLRRANPTYGSEPLTSADIQEVSRIAQSGQFASGTGTMQQADVADAYVQSVARLLRLSGRPRVVLDGGNGVAGPLALRAFEAAGAEVRHCPRWRWRPAWRC
jgi:phosphomannomutase